MKKILNTISAALFCSSFFQSGLSAAFIAGAPFPGQEQERAAFTTADQYGWQEVFFDSCTNDWKQKWFLDGGIGAVSTYDAGMQLTAGPQTDDDAHHMVLWTKESFEGDLKIEFDYTRLDFETRFVNILYIEATGSGNGPYKKDITEWNDLRTVPSMRTYFNNMNTYHLSFAAFGNSREDSKAYIRARRYMPDRSGLKGTEMQPDYYPPEELFAPGVPHRFTVIKKDRELFVRIENPQMVYCCHMTNADLPVINEGRIGLRHMATRSSLYKNFRVSRPAIKPSVSTNFPPTFANVPYGTHERQVLDFWKAEGEGSRPLLVLIHGGGWYLGNKSELFPRYNQFLDRGVSIACINYRLTPGNPLPAPVLDAARAVQFLRSKAAEWNIDPRRVAVAGLSAGACSALWLTTHDDLADPDSDDPVSRQSSRPCGTVAASAQTTIAPRNVQTWVGDKAVEHPMIRNACAFSSNEEMFKAVAENPDVARMYHEFSSINHLSADDPPILLTYKHSVGDIHGSAFGLKFKEKSDATGKTDVFLNIDDDARYSGYPGGIEAFICKILNISGGL